ncbi:AraC family transcriptional regulator [Cecembia sp.]|uniref:AraC family transcriptional regulator n=1 Tax=Cecembia sp. TaxID=1898110 RepID=UPI0025BEEDFF|nr:AraC family transcriptional regulator [Cecembia sp.]
MKQALQKSRIPSNKAFVARELIAPYFDNHWHFHQEYQLFLVLEGRGTRFIGDQMKPFREFDMVFTGPNLPHLWKNDAAYFEKESKLKTHGIVVYFGADFLGNALYEKEELELIRNLFQRSLRGLEITGSTNMKLREKMKELVGKSGFESYLLLLEILKTIANSSDCQTITQAEYTNNNKESEKDRMRKVYEYVTENFQKKIQLEEVANLANMTESAFSRYFKSRMNKTFSEFLSDVRISHACKLLHEQDINISQVCYESGFNTLSNFNKQFKERMSVSPLVYRRDYQRTLE